MCLSYQYHVVPRNPKSEEMGINLFLEGLRSDLLEVIPPRRVFSDTA